MVALFARLLRYAAWADRRALEALRAAPAAQAEALPWLAHLLAAEHVWLARLEQRPPRLAVWPSLTLEACAALVTENEQGYRDYLAHLDDDQCNMVVRYTNTQGEAFATSAADILTQVVTHGSYHRGQIAKAIGRSGTTAVNTDFITFVRETDPSK